MVIDIISYTPAQFAVLNDEQILKIQSAQIKKNRLQAALDEDLKKEKFKLVKNGTFLSTTWSSIQSKLQAEYNAEVENIRDGLLFYLQYSGQVEVENVPYTVDYSLSPSERYEIVKGYYEGNYSTGAARAEAYRQDPIARQYLGEYYAPLYDYFLAQE